MLDNLAARLHAADRYINAPEQGSCYTLADYQAAVAAMSVASKAALSLCTPATLAMLLEAPPAGQHTPAMAALCRSILAALPDAD